MALTLRTYELGEPDRDGFGGYLRPSGPVTVGTELDGGR